MDNGEKTIEESIYTLMKKMDLNTKLIVPYENRCLVMNYASQLQRGFGVKFETCRIKTNKSKLPFLLVIRSQ